MCLLVAISRDREESPLIVAANRDELLDRPAVPMAVLQAHGPRILGGRDDVAGGTWLAVNEAGGGAGAAQPPGPQTRPPPQRGAGGPALCPSPSPGTPPPGRGAAPST